MYTYTCVMHLAPHPYILNSMRQKEKSDRCVYVCMYVCTNVHIHTQRYKIVSHPHIPISVRTDLIFCLLFFHFLNKNRYPEEI